MLIRILLLFTIVPFVELALLIEVGRRIGTGLTLLLIVGTGVAGGLLARSQGIILWRELRAELSAGRVPAAHALDGLFVLAGGLLLLTPGILTDILGFMAMLPPSRAIMRNWLIHRLNIWIKTGSFTLVGQRNHID